MREHQPVSRHRPVPVARIRGTVSSDHGPRVAAPLDRVRAADIMGLQRLVGNNAVNAMVSSHPGGEFLQRQKKQPPGRSPFAQQVFDQLETRNVTAPGGALYLLNGCNPQEMVATIEQLHPHRELGLYGAGLPHGFDGPRLATAFQASLSGRPKEGVQALELLDAYRNYGEDVTAFWRDKVGPIPAPQLELLFRVFDRRVLDSFKKYLGEAPPAVAKKVSPLLGELFNPPARDISIEFRPDQFVVDEPDVKYPDGHIGPAKWPMGVMIARVKDRVAAIVLARGGPWQSIKLGKHTADPTKPGTYTLGKGGPVVPPNAFWKFSQIRWNAPLREIDGASGKEVEYQTVGGAWNNTLKLKDPISRADILAYQKLLGRRELVPPSWTLNEFGPRGYQVGKTDVLIHTTPTTEDQYNDKLEEKLDFSHGCIHIKPSDRDKLDQMNLLKGGVTIIIQPYQRGPKAYGPLPSYGTGE